MIPADQITKRFLIWGVVATAVCPRHSRDVVSGSSSNWRVVGGDLSYSFRRLLLSIAAINLCRLVLSSDDDEEASSSTGISWATTSTLLCDSLGVIEVTGITFLCFLTPYVLQKAMMAQSSTTVGNIHSGSSEDLLCPLYAVAMLSSFCVILSRIVHPSHWCLKKLASVWSSRPVIHILDNYNTVVTTTSGGSSNNGGRRHHNG